MNHDAYPDSYIRRILNTVKTIAMVGVSANTSRPSYFAFKYLLERGYRMIPVNPGLDGQVLLGRKVYARLADIPEPVDMVDIFRASRFAPAIVEAALALEPRPGVIWMQLGVRNDDAAAVAEQAGLQVVMNRCPKIEYGRLSSEIGWMGVNTRTLSARKAQLLGGGVQRMTLNRITTAGGITTVAARATQRADSSSAAAPPPDTGPGQDGDRR
jgi:predicted CoA-binding protein